MGRESGSVQLVVPVSKLSGSDGIFVTHHPDRSWLNVDALRDHVGKINWIIRCQPSRGNNGKIIKIHLELSRILFSSGMSWLFNLRVWSDRGLHGHTRTEVDLGHFL